MASDCALFLVGASTYEQAPMADHEASAGSAGNCAGAVASASELMGSLLGGQCHRSLFDQSTRSLLLHPSDNGGRTSIEQWRSGAMRLYAL